MPQGVFLFAAPAAQSNEPYSLGIELREVLIGGKAGVENQS